MNVLIRACVCTLISFIAYSVAAQDSSVITFLFDKTRVSDTEVLLNIRGKVKPGIKVYALQKSESDPLFSTVTFDTSAVTKLSGSVIESANAHTKKDEAVDAEVTYFTDSVTWQQKVKATEADSFLLKGNVAYRIKKVRNTCQGKRRSSFSFSQK